jgi:hypothetical protein
MEILWKIPSWVLITPLKDTRVFFFFFFNNENTLSFISLFKPSLFFLFLYFKKRHLNRQPWKSNFKLLYCYKLHSPLVFDLKMKEKKYHMWMHMNFFLLKMWFDYLKKRSKGLADLWGNSRTIKNGPKSDRTTHSLKKLFNHLQIGHKNNWLGVVRPRLHFIIFLIVFIFVVRGNLCSFQVKKKKTNHMRVTVVYIFRLF